MRSTTSTSISQTMGRLGSLGINYASTSYWEHSSQNNYGLTYGIGLPWGINLSLSQSRIRSTPAGSSMRNESMTSMFLSMPLGGNSSNSSNSVTASYQGITARQRDTQSLGLRGTGFDRSMTWDVRQSQTRVDGTGSVNNSYLRLGWNGTYGQTGASYSGNISSVPSVLTLMAVCSFMEMA